MSFLNTDSLLSSLLSPTFQYFANTDFFLPLPIFPKKQPVMSVLHVFAYSMAMPESHWKETVHSVSLHVSFVRQT